MMYKTIVLELLQQRPPLHERLRQSRTLLQAMESHAIQLKSRHDTLTEQLTQASPGRAPTQISAEAMEIAVKELEDSLPTD